MKTLYERLKPEIKKSLLKSNRDYKFGPRQVIADLHRFTKYTDLTVDTVISLCIYGDVFELHWENTDWKYGDKLFNK